MDQEEYLIMNYNQATLFAATGHTLMLPGWKGIFVWDYSTNTLIFKNGDYHLTNEQIRNMKLDQRTDWYYII